MSWQSDITAAVTGSSALTTLIGDRFSWDVADGTQAAAPFLVAQVISADGETDFSGVRSLVFPLIQFTAWATSKEQAIGIIATLAREIEGRNLPGDNNVSLGYAGEQSTRDPQTKLYGEIIDYRASANSN